MESNRKKFKRDGKRYTAEYDTSGRLWRLTNENTGERIPSDTQSFRRLADNNRGNKFSAA